MENIFMDISMMVACAACLAWLASLLRQPIIMAYLGSGLLIGPSGLEWVRHVELIDAISRIGVTLLLFLAGMVLHPNRLIRLFRTSIFVTLAHSVISWGILFFILYFYGFNGRESTYAALALMFSSTILAVKLLPTTTLHQRHMGSVCIAILIAQDLLAIGLLVFMSGGPTHSLMELGMVLPLKGVLLIAFAIGFEQFCLRKMMKQSDAFHEVLYMLCLGWCLGISVLAEKLGLSYEVGAFIGGLAMARSPISRFLTEQLKPIRDFFLMFFFFVLGARLDLFLIKGLWLPVLLAGMAVLGTRPILFWVLFRFIGEKDSLAKEAGLRLGQGSEFGLIMAVAAQGIGYISLDVSQLIQLTVIFSMVVSSYIIIFSCPTPLGTQGGLKQD